MINDKILICAQPQTLLHVKACTLEPANGKGGISSPLLNAATYFSTLSF